MMFSHVEYCQGNVDAYSVWRLAAQKCMAKRDAHELRHKSLLDHQELLVRGEDFQKRQHRVLAAAASRVQQCWRRHKSQRESRKRLHKARIWAATLIQVATMVACTNFLEPNLKTHIF